MLLVIPIFASLDYVEYVQTTATLKQYYATCLALVAIIILFGGLIAPVVSPSLISTLVFAHEEEAKDIRLMK